MKIYPICFLKMFLCTVALAQSPIGGEGGLNVAGIRYTEPGGHFRKREPITPIAGVRLGVTWRSKLPAGFSLQPGLHYLRTGFSDDNYGYISALKVNTAEALLNLVLTFGGAASNHYFVGAGSFYGYNFLGKITRSSPGFPTYTRPIDYDNKQQPEYQRTDYGLNLNGGINHQKHWNLKFSYQIGFAEMFPFKNSYYRMRTRSAGLTVGYFIGKGKRTLEKTTQK